MYKVLLMGIVPGLLFFCSVAATPPPPPNYQISTPSDQLQNEQQIWVCPTDSNVICALWRDFRNGFRQLGFGRSTDAGNTWTDRLVVEKYYERQSDPCLDVDAEGNFYICMMDWEATWGEHDALCVMKSTDKGETWPLFPVKAVEGPEGMFLEDKQFITIDRTGGPYHGNFYMSWARFAWDGFDPPTRIMFVRSTDGCQTFSDTLVIGPILDFSDCGGGLQQAGNFSQPIVGSDGSVYVFWCGRDTLDCIGYRNIAMVKSTDGGVSFTAPRTIRLTAGHWNYIDGGIDVYNAPICAADIFGGPYNGSLYISFAEMDITNTEYYDYNVRFIRSIDGGDTWADPININDDYSGPGAMFDQFHPWLYCNQEGTLVCIFYDQRMDSLTHSSFDVFASYSFDGGQSFTTNHRISEVSSNVNDLKRTVGSRAGKIAEYIGVTAYKDHVNAIWTDARNGNQDCFGANWNIPFMEPRLLQPAHGTAYKNCPIMKWATAWKEADDQYRIEIADDELFTNILVSTVTDIPSLPSGAVSGDGNYYWRVKAFRISEGDSSEYSPVFTFILDSYIPPPPTLLAPSDKSSVNDPLPSFTWSSEATILSAHTYTLQVSPDETFTDYLTTREYGNLTDTVFTSPDPVYPDTVYYWRVKATNRWSESNGYGEPFEFDYLEYMCGDASGDGAVNLLDILFLIDFVYGDPPGLPPDPPEAGDPNADGDINLLDILYLIDYLYGSPTGPEPLCP